MVLFLKKLLKINKKRHLSENLQLRFLTQLQSFLNNGYSLLEGLERVKWDKQMISIADLMIHALKKGVPIDRALEDANFHYTVTAYLYFVRESGNLLDSIEKCIQIFKRRIKYKQKFQQMIRYPLLLLFIFIILMFFIKNSILPSFLIIFQTSDDLPTIMKYTIVMIDYFIPIFVLFVILLSIVALWWVRHKKTLNIKIQLKIFKAIPMYRTYLKKQTSFQFATHLSALLKTGMPLKDI